jgi:predicted phosphodiesterase
VRIELLADLHDFIWKPQAGIEALISLGDVPNAVLEQARDAYGCPVFAVKGNHDSVGFCRMVPTYVVTFGVNDAVVLAPALSRERRSLRCRRNHEVRRYG